MLSATWEWLGDILDPDTSLFYDEDLPHGVPFVLGALGLLLVFPCAAYVNLQHASAVTAVVLAVAVFVLGIKWAVVDDARDVLLATFGSTVLLAYLGLRTSGARGVVVAEIAAPIVMRAWAVLAWRLHLRRSWAMNRTRARAILAGESGKGAILHVQHPPADPFRAVLHDASGERPVVVEASLFPRGRAWTDTWYLAGAIEIVEEPDPSEESYREARTRTRVVRLDEPNLLFGDPRGSREPWAGEIVGGVLGLAAIVALVVGVARLLR